MAGTVSPLYFAVAGVGVGLVFSAVRNEQPLALLRSVLTGGDIERAPITRRADAGQGVGFGVVAPIAPAAESIDPELVSIGQGSHRLTPAAARDFARWQTLYGAPIYVTDSYRSFASQSEAHRKDPERFADPRSSMHPKGLAVDVDLGRTTGGQSTNGQPRYDRLRQTAGLAGWLTYGLGKPGTDTWHFSHGRAA